MRFPRITVEPKQMGGSVYPGSPGSGGNGGEHGGRRHDGCADPRRVPDLEREDVREALRYAAEAVRERELPLVKTA